MCSMEILDVLHDDRQVPAHGQARCPGDHDARGGGPRAGRGARVRRVGGVSAEHYVGGAESYTRPARLGT